MTTITTCDESADACRALVFRVDEARRNADDGPMSRRELARLAGMTPTELGHLESRNDLPPALDELLRLALVLGVHVEDLIAPELVADRSVEIESRRGDRTAPDDPNRPLWA